MYAFAIVLWELASQELPYGDADETTIRSSIAEAAIEELNNKSDADPNQARMGF